MRAYLDGLPKRGHGVRGRMAQAMRCEPGYFSRVLNDQAHLSLEQAEALSGFLGHGDEETHFFLLLLQAERAGTPSLQKRFEAQLLAIRDQRRVVRNRVQERMPMTPEQQARYFSHWQFAAVHALVSIPEFQGRDVLRAHLKMSVRRFSEVTSFLVEVGLIAEQPGGFRVGETRLQLSGGSPLISKHHMNWRMRAMGALDDEPDQGLHYSSVMTLSREDAERIREIYLKAIEKMNETVRDSKDQVAIGFTLDLFEV